MTSLWGHVKGWFGQEATHVTVRFLPDAADPVGPIAANGGYLRLFAAEGFLAEQRTWTADRFPALHGGATVTFGGVPATFGSFSRAPDAWAAPGARLDVPITPLLPFAGGTVELEAALFRATVAGPLGTAVSLATSLAGLIGPPLATAAAVAGKISDGLGQVVEASGERPVLAVHWTMVAPGGGGNLVRPGHLVVLGRPERDLGGEPEVVGGRLQLRTGARSALPTGVDYLVLRVECRTERDDWRLPDLAHLLDAAKEAYLLSGDTEVYAARRKAALVAVHTSADLVQNDRRRVALLIQDELDDLANLGAAPRPGESFEELAGRRLVPADDSRLADATLETLLR